MRETEEKTNTAPLDLLKDVLAHLRKPQALNDHPWAVQINSTGEELVNRTAGAFRKMLPPNPPHTGKRLDPRWGSFGILAAQYFAPLALGTPFPNSLREAAGSIDRSIYYFVYGRADGLGDAETARYSLTGKELEPTPNSTLSDWHRKGLEQLLELTTLELEKKSTYAKPVFRRQVRRIFTVLGLTLLLVAAFFGWKAWNLLEHVNTVETEAKALETYLSPLPSLEKIPEIAGKVHTLRTDLDALQMEAEPYLWITPYLGWVPRYGGTISQAEEVLTLAGSLATAADEGLTAITPAVQLAVTNDQPLEVMDLLLQLQSASPQLLNAQISLAQAQEARTQIDTARLIPRIGNIITGRIDPLFTTISGAFPMEDALAMVRIAPKLLGAGKAGPQTYLILIQNEDELRPTGGFLSAAGSAVVMDGRLISINIESSDLVDDLKKVYPSPPWQFKEFMNIEMLLFRDSNWFTDFPKTAAMAEYFYSYSRASSADGVLAIDMQMITRLLETLGPVRVDNVSFPITHENVQDYLRSAEKARPAGVTGVWNRKQFISDLAKPVLEKILNARGATWTRLVPVLMDLLDEKHILIQMDNEEVTAFLQRRNWDGAVRIPQGSDFLMAVDANMGYNKSNAIMESAFEYTVDLMNPENPGGLLRVLQTNHSKLDIPCEPWSTSRFILRPALPGEIPDPVYNIDECHWGYWRVYTPAGTTLLNSNPQAIPAEATWLGEAIPARTDDLGSEEIAGAQVFGMMVLTPTRQTTTSEFETRLPAGVLTRENETWTYHLKVQKQPGMLAQPFHLNLKLPDGARIENAALPFIENDGVWTAMLDLRRDLMIEVRFK